MGLPTRAINHATYRAKKPDRTRSEQETLAYAEAALSTAKRDGLLLVRRDGSGRDLPVGTSTSTTRAPDAMLGASLAEMSRFA